MGAGKSSVGRACAERLDRPFVDVDDVVVATAGRPVPEIFADLGEAGFRALERRALDDVCRSPAPLVIACGGGAVVDPDNRRRVRDAGCVVWLTADSATLAARVGAGDEQARRPLLTDGDPPVATLDRLATLRAPAYAAAAHATVDTAGRSVADVADLVLEEFARWSA